MGVWDAEHRLPTGRRRGVNCGGSSGLTLQLSSAHGLLTPSPGVRGPSGSGLLTACLLRGLDFLSLPGPRRPPTQDPEWVS